MFSIEVIFSKVVSFQPQLCQKKKLLRSCFSKFLTSRKEELFCRTPLGDCFCLAANQVDFLLFFKNVIRDGFYQKGADLPRAKPWAMFVLIATAILCQFKHACVLVNIYFNDMQIYRRMYYISHMHIHSFRKYTNFYKLFC